MNRAQRQTLTDFQQTIDEMLVGQMFLAEAFYEENQIYLAQQRIMKFRIGIERERNRINQLRTVLHRRKEQERAKKKSSNDEED